MTGRIGESRSHALRGNALCDAPRRNHRPGWAAERPGRLPTQSWNEEPDILAAISISRTFIWLTGSVLDDYAADEPGTARPAATPSSAPGSGRR